MRTSPEATTTHDPDELLTTREVAGILKISEQHLRQKIRRGEIISTRLSSGPRSRYRIRRSDLSSYLDAHSSRHALAKAS